MQPTPSRVLGLANKGNSAIKRSRYNILIPSQQGPQISDIYRKEANWWNFDRNNETGWDKVLILNVLDRTT